MFAGLGLFDALCLIVMFISCLIGIWRGFAFEVLSLAAWGGAFFAAQWLSVMFTPFWPQQWLANNSQARYVLAFVIIFLLALLALGLLASAARNGVKKTGLRPFDRILGLTFGMIRAILVLWTLTVVIWLTPLHKNLWWQQAQAAPLLDSSLRTMAPLLPTSLAQWLPPALRANHPTL